MEFVYNGEKYKSLRAACIEKHVSYQSVLQRSYRTGESKEESLHAMINKEKVIINGLEFTSWNAACKYYDVNMPSVTAKIDREKISQEEAINLLRMRGRELHSSKEFITVYGNKFPSYRAACDFYKKDYARIMTNMRNHNITFEEALNDTFKRKREIVIGDKKYESLNEACTDNKIHPVTFYNRLNNGMSETEAITKKKWESNKIGKNKKTKSTNKKANKKKREIIDIKKIFYSKQKNKWKSNVVFDKKYYYLGIYETMERALAEAAIAEEVIKKGEDFLNWYYQRKEEREKMLGCTYEKRSNKWRAQIRFNGKTFYLGVYEKKEDARKVYLKAKEIIENNGEFEKWHSELICKKREGGKEND